MKLYHGSISLVDKPNIEQGRPSTDFGKGFYVTTNFEQAKRWALYKQKNAKGEVQAIVSTYEVDDKLIDNERYRIKKFDSPNEEWLSFVVNCRKSMLHDYEIVFGAVANDKIYTTITLYESQVLTAEETVARLKVNEYFNQVSFHSQEAVDELTFIESIEVSE
ncbi:DUF3990 domain-containing protein [Massilibacteroides sp.]|uniref:DUF3990 domain-containing protein n=1 Tax=Massilibacteroides sp. TaxID=2034766 RepID=UPI0026384B9B|nr:DUF3990 domain-containing protein [Massilibacteroides sp.]MDD4516511.1 DUF3990 domain-containing protein [Massilibacteroides sp.]